MKLFDRLLYKMVFGVCITILTIGWLCANRANGQGQTGQTISNASYRSVLDLLFPRNLIEDEKAEYVVIARYEPSFTAEYQITLVKKGGKWSVIKHQSESGNIYYKLDKIISRTRRENVAWLARQATVRREEIALSEKQIESLYRDFIDQAILQLKAEKPDDTPSSDGTVLVTMDGTRYRIWYRGVGMLEYELTGSNPDQPKKQFEDPLVSWMKKLSSVTLSQHSRL